MTYKEVIKYFKERKSDLGLSYADIANRTGLSRRMVISLLSNMEGNMTWGTLVKIANSLELSITFTKYKNENN